MPICRRVVFDVCVSARVAHLHARREARARGGDELRGASVDEREVGKRARDARAHRLERIGGEDLRGALPRNRPLGGGDSLPHRGANRRRIVPGRDSALPAPVAISYRLWRSGAALPSTNTATLADVLAPARCDMSMPSTTRGAVAPRRAIPSVAARLSAASAASAAFLAASAAFARASDASARKEPPGARRRGAGRAVTGDSVVSFDRPFLFRHSRRRYLRQWKTSSSSSTFSTLRNRRVLREGAQDPFQPRRVWELVGDVHVVGRVGRLAEPVRVIGHRRIRPAPAPERVVGLRAPLRRLAQRGFGLDEGFVFRRGVHAVARRRFLFRHSRRFARTSRPANESSRRFPLTPPRTPLTSPSRATPRSLDPSRASSHF